MNIRGIAHTDLPPRAVAQDVYRNGEGQDANPYPQGSRERDQFAMEMHRLQLEELKGLEAELRAGI